MRLFRWMVFIALVNASRLQHNKIILDNVILQGSGTTLSVTGAVAVDSLSVGGKSFSYHRYYRGVAPDTTQTLPLNGNHKITMLPDFTFTALADKVYRVRLQVTMYTASGWLRTGTLKMVIDGTAILHTTHIMSSYTNAGTAWWSKSAEALLACPTDFTCGQSHTLTFTAGYDGTGTQQVKGTGPNGNTFYTVEEIPSTNTW